MNRSKLFTLLLGLIFTFQNLSAQKKADITIGKVFNVKSQILDQTREYRVLLPKSYDSSQKHYPVIYVLDGESYFLSAYSAMLTLSGLSAMPEAIVIAVSNPQRTTYMSPPEMEIYGVPAAKADVFLKFLSDELIPLVNESYRTLPLRVLIGHSHGAIFNLYALSKNPEAFKWHIALDAPTHLDNSYLERAVADFVKNNPDHSGRLVVGWNRYSWNDQRWEALSKEKKTGLKVWEIDLEGETHSSMYHVGFYKGLKRLFADHDYVHDKVLTYKELSDRYETMNREYGYEIPIPIWGLRYGALEHLTSANPREAELFVKALKRESGSAMIMDDDAEEWFNELKNNPPKMTREEYLSLPEAKTKEARSYLGKWSNNQYSIELKDKNGIVTGVLGQRMPDGEERFQDLNKVIILDDGSLEVSHPNGMPPRSGLIVYKLTLTEKNAIQASQRFQVYWPRMEGRMKPENFRLNKVN